VYTTHEHSTAPPPPPPPPAAAAAAVLIVVVNVHKLKRVHTIYNPYHKIPMMKIFSIHIGPSGL
jgi:hypothetical protein